MLKFISSEDEKRINAFLEAYAKRFVSHYLPDNPPPHRLYHYTTGDNLIQIIQSQELWATQASCLNDTTELTYAADQLRQRIKKRALDTDTKKIERFRARLVEFLENPSPEIAGMFVTCFTEKEDDLSQWRSYSGGEGGYAIQFDTLKLLLSGAASFATSKFWQPLVQVAYKLEDEFLDQLLAFGEQCSVELQGASRAPTEEEWLDDFVTHWITQIAFLAPCLKHPKFESEKEWRFLFALRPDDITRMRFRQRQYLMSRHVPLILTTPLPITGVLVGPCRHPQLSKIAVGDLLKANGYDPDVVKVALTDVPYRAA
jgi:hypothetical protein